jgi:hypothetical protein
MYIHKHTHTHTHIYIYIYIYIHIRQTIRAYWTNSYSFRDVVEIGGGGSQFDVLCKDCYTTGYVKPSLEDEETQTVKILFNEFGGYFDFSLKTATANTEAVKLVSIQPPSNTRVSDDTGEKKNYTP